MAKGNVCDMTVGNETSLLLKFSLPMLVGNIFQQCYSLVDSVIVGRYVGKNALAAVGMTSSLNYLYFCLCNGFAIGAGVLISQYFGMKEEKKVKDVIGNSVYLLLAMGLLVSVCSIAVSRSILTLLNTPEIIFEDALLYTRIFCGGMIATVFYNGIAAMLRALGDSRTPLIFLVISSVLNIVGDMVLVLVFHLGVAGVAIATVASQMVSAIGCMIYAALKNPYFKLSKENFRPNRKILKRAVVLGVPFGLQGSLISFSCIALQSVINQFGENVIAAYTATCKIEQLVQEPFNTLGMAIATFSGQNLGAGKIDRVKRGYFRSNQFVFGFGILMWVVMNLFGRALVGIFVSDGAVIEIGAQGLRISSLFYIPLGLIYSTRSLMNGVGDSPFSLVSGLAEVVGRIGFSVLLAGIPALGYKAVWFTSGLTWLITGLVCVFRYLQGKWKHMGAVQ